MCHEPTNREGDGGDRRRIEQQHHRCGRFPCARAGRCGVGVMVCGVWGQVRAMGRAWRKMLLVVVLAMWSGLFRVI